MRLGGRLHRRPRGHLQRRLEKSSCGSSGSEGRLVGQRLRERLEGRLQERLEARLEGNCKGGCEQHCRHDRRPSDRRRSHITRSVGCDARRPTGEAHGIGTAGLGCANSVDTEGLGHEAARSIIAAPWRCGSLLSNCRRLWLLWLLEHSRPSAAERQAYETVPRCTYYATSVRRRRGRLLAHATVVARATRERGPGGKALGVQKVSLHGMRVSALFYLFTAEAAHARLPFARPRRPRSPRLSAVTRAASARSERADIGVHLPGVRLYPRTIAPQHICSHPCAVLVLRNYHRRVLISVAQLFLAAEAATVTELIFWCAYSCQQAATVTTRSCGA